MTYQWSRSQPAHRQAAPEQDPREARRAAQEAERRRLAERGPGQVKHWWQVIAAAPETKAGTPREDWDEAVSSMLSTHRAWHQRIGRRLEQVGQLVERVREAEVVRARPDLVEELDHLDLLDLKPCLRTVAIVLAEALGRPSALSQPDGDYDAWFRSLARLVEEAEQARHEVRVVAGPDGRIDGRMPRRALSGVEVKDCAGVMWGADNRLEVTHLCVVDNPVVEVAELVRLAEDGLVFDLSAWLFKPSQGGAAGGASLDGGYWVRISNCAGVTIGNSNDVDLTYTYKMDSCHVNLGLLLRDPKVRADLALSRDDSPANAEQAQAARRRLPETVARATGAIDLKHLVPEDRIAEQAALARRPRVRRGGRGLIVSHGAGVVVGLDPTVHSRTVTRVGAFRIKPD